MSAANPNPIEKSMVSVLVVENVGGGVAVAVWWGTVGRDSCSYGRWRYPLSTIM
jgi:hypothetical protein